MWGHTLKKTKNNPPSAHSVVSSDHVCDDILQMQSSEEGLQQADELVRSYLHSCSWFIGPFYHLVRLFHPDYVKPLLMAPGSGPDPPVCCHLTVERQRRREVGTDLTC